MRINRDNGHLLQLLKNDRYFYAAGQLFLLCAAFLFNLVAAKLLGPVQMGVWASISLVSMYGMALTFGVMNGMGRDIPYYRGQNDACEVDRTISTATIWLVAIVTFLLLTTLLLYQLLSEVLRTVIVLGFLLLCARIVNVFSMILIRSFRDFRCLGLHQALTGLIMLTTLIILLYKPRLAVVFSGIFLSLIIGILLSHRFIVIGQLSLECLKRLMKTGLPIYIVGLLFVLLTSIDRIIILYYLGTMQLGLYTLASTALAVLMMVPSLASNVMYPKLAEHYGATGEVSNLIPLVSRLIRLNMFLTIPIAVLFFVAFYFYIVPVYLVAYMDGRNAMAIMMIAAFFLPAGLSYGDCFNVINKQNLYIRNVLGGLLLNVVVGVLLVGKVGMGLEGAAISALCGLMLFTVLQIGTGRSVLASNMNKEKVLTETQNDVVSP